MKKVLKTILKVYMIICTCLFTLILIAGIIVAANLGKITGFIMRTVVDNFNAPITDVVSTFVADAIPDGSVKVESITTLPDGQGIKTSLKIDNNLIDQQLLEDFKTKSNQEILAELGITPADIPDEVKSILSIINETLVLDFKDEKGNPVISREITIKEITDFLNN